MKQGVRFDLIILQNINLKEDEIKMKYMHVIWNDKFSEMFIKFLNNNFDPNEHHFVYMGGLNPNEFPITEGPNIFYNRSKLKSYFYFLRKIYTSDKIYIHGLFNPHVVLLLFLQPWITKKCNWIVFGGDLYTYKKPKLTIKSKIYEMMRRGVISRFGSISTLVKGDYELVKKWYITKAKYNEAKYLNLDRIEYLDKLLKNSSNKLKKEYVSIIIGNSATATNNHKEVLDYISKFKSEDIRIYCPLSYGNKQYGEEIIEYAQNIFGEKFVPILNYMDLFEYMDFLNNMDIGIFNNDRQQGMGNISSLVYLGKKVYLSKNTVMWHHFTENIGLEIYDVNCLKEQNFNDLVFLNNKAKENNYSQIKNKYDKESLKNIWQNIFTS